MHECFHSPPFGPSSPNSKELSWLLADLLSSRLLIQILIPAKVDPLISPEMILESRQGIDCDAHQPSQTLEDGNVVIFIDSW